HLENMLKLARMGVSILPPVPAFYNHPQTVDDIVNHIVGRVLDQFDIPAPFAKRWDGHMHTATKIATVAPSAAPAAKGRTGGTQRTRSAANDPWITSSASGTNLPGRPRRSTLGQRRPTIGLLHASGAR